MPRRCASWYCGGMIVSTSGRPTASSRVQPKIFSAWLFQSGDDACGVHLHYRIQSRLNNGVELFLVFNQRQLRLLAFGDIA